MIRSGCHLHAAPVHSCPEFPAWPCFTHPYPHRKPGENSSSVFSGCKSDRIGCSGADCEDLQGQQGRGNCGSCPSQTGPQAGGGNTRPHVPVTCGQHNHDVRMCSMRPVDLHGWFGEANATSAGRSCVSSCPCPSQHISEIRGRRTSSSGSSVRTVQTIRSIVYHLMGTSMSKCAVAAAVAMELVVSASASPIDDGPGLNYWSPGLVACAMMAAVATFGGALCSKASAGSNVAARAEDQVRFPCNTT